MVFEEIETLAFEEIYWLLKKEKKHLSLDKSTIKFDHYAFAFNQRKTWASEGKKR